MVGVSGVVAHSQQELTQALDKAGQDEQIGLVLITSKLIREHDSLVFSYKEKWRTPLIVEMPDRHGGDDVSDSIKQYLLGVLGIKL